MSYRSRINSAIKFDSRAIIEFMGGIAAVHGVLRSMGCHVGRKTVQKWRERNNMPAHAIATIAAFQYEMAKPFPLFEFIIDESPSELVD